MHHSILSRLTTVYPLNFLLHSQQKETRDPFHAGNSTPSRTIYQTHKFRFK